MVTKDKKWWTFEVLGPSMIYNMFNREISCHHITVSLHHCITASLSVSHLPCPLPPSQSVICLAPCHQTSQSFALPPTTRVTASPRHHVTASPCHHVTTSPHHRATVSLHHRITVSPHHRITAPLRHCTTAPPHHPHHRVTALVSHLPFPLPPSQSVICLAPCHQTSQSFALPPTTTSPCHRVTTPLRHRISQSFALPPATKPVSHLPCPLPPNQSVICLAPYHRITASPRHCVTASPRHRVTASDFPHHMGMNLIG